MGKGVLMIRKKNEQNKTSSVADLNMRFITSISYFISWAKHIITIASAIMVISLTFLNEIVKSTDSRIRLFVIIILIIVYICFLASIWISLRFISKAASIMMTLKKNIATGDNLDELQKLIKSAQVLFLVGLICFSVMAFISLISWALSSSSS